MRGILCEGKGLGKREVGRPGQVAPPPPQAHGAQINPARSQRLQL